MTFNLLYPAAFDTPQNISKHCIVHISFLVLSHSFYQRHPIESFIYRIPELIFSTCNCFMCLLFTSKHDFRLIIIWMIIPGTCSIYQLNSWSNFNLSNNRHSKNFSVYLHNIFWQTFRNCIFSETVFAYLPMAEKLLNNISVFIN